jgi:hypothetical protein
MIDKLKLQNVLNRKSDRKQLSSAIDTDLLNRFDSFCMSYGHGSKKVLLELAIRNLLDELENK